MRKMKIPQVSVDPEKIDTDSEAINTKKAKQI